MDLNVHNEMLAKYEYCNTQEKRKNLMKKIWEGPYDVSEWVKLKNYMFQTLANLKYGEGCIPAEFDFRDLLKVEEMCEFMIKEADDGKWLTIPDTKFNPFGDVARHIKKVNSTVLFHRDRMEYICEYEARRNEKKPDLHEMMNLHYEIERVQENGTKIPLIRSHSVIANKNELILVSVTDLRKRISPLYIWEKKT